MKLFVRLAVAASAVATADAVFAIDVDGDGDIDAMSGSYHIVAGPYSDGVSHDVVGAASYASEYVFVDHATEDLVATGVEGCFRARETRRNPPR